MPHRLVPALVALAATLPAVDAPNLLPSPGFEDGIQGWTGYPTFPIQRTTDPVRSGRYALPLPQGEADGPGWSKGRWMATGMQSMALAVEPGATYRFTVQVRATGGRPVPLTLSVGRDHYPSARFPDTRQTVPADEAWHAVELAVPVPAEVRLITLNLAAGAPCVVDDCAFVRTAAAPPSAVAVEAGGSPWLAPGADAVVPVRLAGRPGPARLLVEARLPARTPPRDQLGDTYGEVLCRPAPVEVLIPADGGLDVPVRLPTAGLPDTGIQLRLRVEDAGGRELGSAIAERFIAARPDWRTWAAVGAQNYQKNRFDGTWLRQLRELGGETSRECIPLPLSYRNAVPGAYTEGPLDLRLAYPARLGLKWLAAVHVGCNNAPAWLMEAPANRRQAFDGTVPQRPLLCIHAKAVREAVFADAERTGRALEDAPPVYGAQVDNELDMLDCWCDAAQASFRAFVQERFLGDLAALNRAWGTAFTVWEQVRQPERMATNYHDDPVGMLDVRSAQARIPAQDLLWLRWRSQVLAGFYRDWTAAFKRGSPSLPVLNNHIIYASAMPRFFHLAPVDHFRFAEFFDVGGLDTCPYNEGREYVAYQTALINSAWWDRPLWVPELYYNPGQLDPNKVPFDLTYLYGRKGTQASLFCWPVLGDKDGAAYSGEFSKEHPEVFAHVRTGIGEFRRLAAELPPERLHEVERPVGILWSPSAHAYPLARWGAADLAGTDALYDLHRVVDDLQYGVRFVDAQAVGGGADPRVRALLVGGMQAMEPALWDRLTAWAEAGGLLILNGPVGLTDDALVPAVAAPCDRGAGIGIALRGWQGGATALFSAGVSDQVKLGRHRKLRGFGRFQDVRLDPAWSVLMPAEDGAPGVVSRRLGRGRVVWMLTDVANPYGLYRTPNTLAFIEGLLESEGIGRLVRVVDDQDQPAPQVAVAAKRMGDELVLFLHHYAGTDGRFRIHVNQPVAGGTARDVLRGTAIPVAASTSGGSLLVDLDAHGYRVLRLPLPAGADLAHLGVQPVGRAPGDLAARQASQKPVPPPAGCSLESSTGTDGQVVATLRSPSIQAVLGAAGARVAALSDPVGGANQVLLPEGVLPVEGMPHGPAGGIKAVVGPRQESFPGITLDQRFSLTERSATATGAATTWTWTDPAWSVSQTWSVSQAVPGLAWTLAQGPRKEAALLRPFLHANLAPGGEVKRGLRMQAGQGPARSFSADYRLGERMAVPVGPASWAAVVDAERSVATLAVLGGGFTAVGFWNDVASLNLEATAPAAQVAAGASQEASAVFHVLNGLATVDFVAAGMAGSLRCWAESGGQSVAVSAVRIGPAAGERRLAIGGVRATGEERDLGSLAIAPEPIRAVEKGLSMGGSGTGYDRYRFYLVDGDRRILVGERDGR